MTARLAAYAPLMRLPLAAAAAALALAAPAAAAPRYKLCDNPQRAYRVVAVADGVTCASGRALATEYHRRVVAQTLTSKVWGWTCGDPRGGMFYGLYGSRTTCFRAGQHVRFDYRGE